jgi:ubiquinone biosynthesis protein UbiJ
VNRIDPTFGVAALGALETAVNAALALDPQTLQRLGKLEGKVIELRLIQPAVTLHVAPGPEGLRLMGYFEGVPDVSLAGSASAFLRLRSEPALPGDLSVAGDETVAAEFQRILAQLDFDLEEHLSHIAGDVVAHEAGRMARGAAALVQEAAAALRHGVKPAAGGAASSIHRAAEELRAGAEQLAADIVNKRRG